MQNKSGKVFVLRSIDSTTASVAQEARFEVSDWAALCSLLQKPPSEFDPRAIFDLDPKDVTALVENFELDFDPREIAVELHPWHPR
jgi:DNA primase